ncbi:MAG: sialidase family protein [Pseudomonadota bacterium]
MEFRIRPFFLDGEVMAVDHITGTYGGRLAVVASTRSSGTFFATSEDDGVTWVKSTSQSNVKSVDAVTLRQNGMDVHLLYALTRGSANNWLLEYSEDWGKTWTNQRIEATHADKDSVDAAQIVVSVNLGGQFVKNQLVIVNDELRVYNPNAQNWFSKPNVKPGGVAAYSANAWIHDSQSGDLLFAKDPYKEIPRAVSWKGCPSTLARSWFSSGPNELFAVTPEGDLYSAAFRDFTWRKVDTGQAPFGGFAKVVYTEAGVWLIDAFGQLYRYGSDERLAEFKPDQGIPSDLGQIAHPSLANAVSGFISGTSFAGLTSDYIASMPGLKVCASSETAKTFAMVMGERGADINIMTVQDMADAYLKTYAWWLGTGGLGDDQKTKRFDRIKRFYSRNEPSPRCEIMLTEGTLDSDSPWNDSRELGNKLYDLKLEFGNDWVAHQLYSPQTGLAASTP